MGVNRGYKPAEQVIMDDWFRPPMDTLGLVLQTAEGQQQAGEAALAKIGETQFKHLPADTPNAEPVYKDIYANIDRLAQGAMGDGDLRKVKSDIDRYARETQRRFRPEGDIGKMISNYEAFNKWNEELGKLVGKPVGDGGITAQHAAALRAKVLADYEAKGGIGKKDDITGYNQIGLKDAALAIDENKLVEEYGKGYIADSRQGVATDPKTGKILPGAVWRQNGKIWKKTTTGEKEVAYQDVFRDLLSSITQHEGYMQYQQQLKELGLSSYGAGDLYRKDENGELLLDKDGQATLDRNHPVVAAAMRGASKFGFTEISYDEDIKFDPYQLEYYKSGLRQKEERMKGQTLVLESNALNRDLVPDEIAAHSKGLTEKIAARTTYIEKLKKEIAGANPVDAAILQTKLNVELQAQNLEKAQKRNADAKLEKLSAQGGVDMQKLFKEKTQSLRNPDGSKITYEQFKAIVTGDSPIQNFKVVMPGNEGGKNAYDPKTSDVFVGSGDQDLANLRNIVKGAANKGATLGVIEKRNVILTTDNTQLGEKMDLIKTAIANGSVNFVSEDGGVSFNSTKFAQLVAEGKVDVVPTTDPVNGMAGFQINVKEKSGIKTYTGNVIGLENQTWFQDLAVHLSDQAEVAGIASAKGQQLKKLSNMYNGMGAQASDASGNPTGQGSLGSQLTDLSAVVYDDGDWLPEVYLPYGVTAELKSAGGGQYYPVFYTNTNGVKTPVDRKNLESVSENPLPQGTMSLSDFQSWVGSAKNLQTLRNKPITR